MSIGKSSIARAVNATATNTKSVNTESVLTKLSIDSIGLLTPTNSADNISDIKASIKKRGILSPVLIAATAKGDLWLIDGYNRLFAAKELGITQLNATVINVENKSEVNRIFAELTKLKTNTIVKTDNIHQEKFRVLCVKDHDLPTYLL